MVTKLRSSLTYANVMASLAVFMVLGGGAYAATKLPKNSVTTIQVKDRSLLAKDFKAGQLPKGAKGATGDIGPQGIQGPAGKDGINGTNGTNGKDGANAATTLTYHRVVRAGVADKAFDTATAHCDSDERMIGGGGGWINIGSNDPVGDRNLAFSGPSTGSNSADLSSTPDGWTTSGKNTSDGGFAARLTAYVICAKP